MAIPLKDGIHRFGPSKSDVLVHTMQVPARLHAVHILHCCLALCRRRLVESHWPVVMQRSTERVERDICLYPTRQIALRRTKAFDQIRIDLGCPGIMTLLVRLT